MTESEKIKKLNELIEAEANAMSQEEQKRIQQEYASLFKTTELWKTFEEGEE